MKDERHVQTVAAVSAIVRSFARWSSRVIRLPMMEEAKPHCGERASLMVQYRIRVAWEALAADASSEMP